MNLALGALAILAATPVVRGRLALGPDPAPAARRAALATLAGLATLTILVGPVLAAAADVSAPTVRIAAGLVISVTVLPDLWRRPVVAAATEPPWRAGLVPVAFPELFGPPLVAALTASATDLGLGPAMALTGVALLAVAGVDSLPGERTATRLLRSVCGLRAAAAVAVGIAVTMNGIYDI